MQRSSALAGQAPRTKTRETSPEIGELRPAEEIVPRLGAKPGLPTARVGPVTAFDRPLQDATGNFATSSLKLPLRLAERKHQLIVAWILEAVEVGGLMRALIRSSHPDGGIWIVSYKKEHERPGVPTYDDILRAGLGAGWVDNKVLNVGTMLQATRFVERRPGARSVSGGPRSRPSYLQ